MRILISGGGTGGHIFPAIAIADALREKERDAEFLFVGAQGKMEMQKVPMAGYAIEGLPISGFQRKFTIDNVKLIFRLIKSLWKANEIMNRFKPDIAIGVGGYASGPMLRIAGWKKVPILIQEQNSFPGITNRLMAGKAKKICVAFEQMNRFFDPAKILLTGNPVRQDLVSDCDRMSAYQYFGLDSAKKTIGIFGGSLGARTLNETIEANASNIEKLDDVQILWQVGKFYYDEFKNKKAYKLKQVKMLPFVDRMDYAYGVCDVAITRAGALTLAEIMVRSIPTILVPSPNVAEDHQRKNAESLVQIEAAEMILDVNAKKDLWPAIIHLLNDESRKRKMKEVLKGLAKPEAASDIADAVIEIVKCKN